MPSMAEASKEGDDRRAHTVRAVTLPTAWERGSSTGSTRVWARGARAHRVPGLQCLCDCGHEPGRTLDESDHVSCGEGFLGVLAHPAHVQPGEEMRTEHHVDRLGGGTEDLTGSSAQWLRLGSAGVDRRAVRGRDDRAGPFASDIGLEPSEGGGVPPLGTRGDGSEATVTDSSSGSNSAASTSARRAGLGRLAPAARLEEGGNPEPIGVQQVLDEGRQADSIGGREWMAKPSHEWNAGVDPVAEPT